jgi:hypothetical protein
MKSTSFGLQKSRRLSRIRLNRQLRNRGVDEVRIAYCEFDGCLLATLCVSSEFGQSVRTSLPRRLRNEIRHLFETIVFERHRDDVALLDRAGTIVWKLERDVISHRHCGYRQQYFSTSEDVSTEQQSRSSRV